MAKYVADFCEKLMNEAEILKEKRGEIMREVNAYVEQLLNDITGKYLGLGKPTNFEWDTMLPFPSDRLQIKPDNVENK
jgi:hypothetical protein